MSISEETKKSVRGRLASYRERRMGIAKKKALLLLFGGLSLGLSGSPRTSWKIIGALTKEWKELGRQASERAVNSLYASRLVGAVANPDGSFTLTLNDNGRKRALKYDLHRMKIQRPPLWDTRWRMVSFDIPEKDREARNALRGHLLRLGFYEQHQSFFIYPFDCRGEIEYLIELYNLRKYVRFILAVSIDNDYVVKKFFGLEQAP